MLIPSAVEKLHDPYTSLDKSASHDSAMGEGTWSGNIGTIHFECAFAFGRKVGKFGYAGLHAESHFVLGDTSLDFRIA